MMQGFSVSISAIPFSTMIGFSVLSASFAQNAVATPPDAIAIYQAKPATAFDVFMMSANQSIRAEANVQFAHTISDNQDFQIARNTTHRIPKELVEGWRNRTHLNFLGLKYNARTKTFTALFDVDVPPHNPIYEASLDSEGEKERESLIRERHAFASSLVKMAITEASLLGRWDLDAKEELGLAGAFRDEVASRTTIDLNWWFSTSGVDTDMPTPTLLRKQGVAIRHYRASGALSHETAEKQRLIRVSHNDFKDAKEWAKWRQDVFETDSR